MKQTWNLEPFFAGGSRSEQFARFLKEIEEHLKNIPLQPLPKAILTSQTVSRDLEEADSFVTCLEAQDVNDTKAKELRVTVTTLQGENKKVKVLLDEKLNQLSDFEALFNDPELKELRFVLEERRRLSKKRLKAEKESLIEDLALDGYHGWSYYHNTLVDALVFPLKGEKLSQGRLDNCFAKPDRAIRKAAFKSYLKTYKTHEQQFGAILNHIGGFRLKMYGARGWKSVTEDPCDYNRIQPETLNTLWDVVAKNRHRLLPFLKAKAKCLGLKKLSYYDLEAPIGQQQQSDISYSEGVAFILKHFHEVSPSLAAFSQKALENGYVETEDRKGKQPGGFCAHFPKSREARVFMTYSNTMTNVVVLAHELGHAFHAHCCFSLPFFNQNYAMNVAETASTMAEMIIGEAAYRTAKTPEEKLSLLNDKLTRSISYLMNLHARFIFETRFYEERAKGFILPERLSQMMVEAQKEAYGDSLAEYNPQFWASKSHFYLTYVPFYNFPYTFGYLFSIGIYDHLLKEPKRFDERYIALLQDTARMTTEELAKKHLGVDLTKPAFWQAAIDRAAHDVEEFIHHSPVQFS